MKIRSIGAVMRAGALKSGVIFIGTDRGQTFVGLTLADLYNIRGTEYSALSISGKRPEFVKHNHSAIAISNPAIEPVMSLETIDMLDQNPSAGELVLTRTTALIAVQPQQNGGIIYCDAMNGKMIPRFDGNFVRFKKWRIVFKIDDNDDYQELLTVSA